MRSTYRVQVREGFGLDDAAGLVPYLADLGVTDLYLSPILMAQDGSTHGYDVVDHSVIDPAIGGGAAYDRLIAALDERGMQLILDVVPNHMAADGRANRWWWDVLENGPGSPFARYFDIDWDPPDLRLFARVLVPILADHVGRVLDSGGIGLARLGGTFVLRYGGRELPVSPRSIDDLLRRAADRAGSAGATLRVLADQFGNLPHALLTDRDAVAERHATKTWLADELDRLCATDSAIGEALEAEVEATAADPDLLDELLQRQNYRLAYWRTAAEELDYRRFFNIESLVGLRIEGDDAFADTHHLTLELARAETVGGLRIDHIDGLADPAGYLERIAGETGDGYVVVEKILGTGESLPPSWAVAGTTGYDFLAIVNGLWVDTDAEDAMTSVYTRFTGEPGSYEEVAYTAKLQIMQSELAAEVDRLTGLLVDICERHRRHRDHTPRQLRWALREVLAGLPVYRTYVEDPEGSRPHIETALAAALRRDPRIDRELLDMLARIVTGGTENALERELAVRFAQVSGAVTAKGGEDTAFYRYNRLLSLNEVGSDPARFGTRPEEFHDWCVRAAERWPEGMITLETHDTKRSADVRARMSVLSEMPDAWAEAVDAWSKYNERHRDADWSDPNMEYALYQTLVGAWPVGVDRVVATMEKSAREAKLRTSWVEPDDAYDKAFHGFLTAVVGDEQFHVMVEDFLATHRVRECGRMNSLAQTALLLTAPGRPDLYQGTEVWRSSLVDPDNRRPVDFERRRALLEEVRGGSWTELRERQDDGAVKLWLTHRLLQLRPTFADADYEPVEVRGPHHDRVIAFRRGSVVVATTRLAGSVGSWDDTEIELPGPAWVDVLTGTAVSGGVVGAGDVFGALPTAVLTLAG